MSESCPDNIGSFRILSKLGQGGMGSVYRAVQGTLERPVALKVLPPEFAHHTEYVARFLREARTIAAIRHENIIQVYDSGEFKGQYYIAMELVDGGNLLNVADAREKISEADGLRMMLQAAKGLNAAHAKGLIHRDIKPENLLIGTDNVLRIVDFGLVMDSGSATQLTLAGTCLGTPMYMSPEQADGETADPRSDLYALGATFFRVFTGRPPFGSATVMNILYKQKFERPPDPQALRPDLSRGASDLLLHLLAKRREDRPEGATALIAMIEDALAGRPIAAPPPFAPLVPKPKGDAEDGEQREGASSETGALFGSSSQRSGGASGAQSGLLTAAILLIIVAAAVFALTSGRKQENTLVTATTVNVKPAVSDAELRERVALGDEAFRAGRIKDARAIYLDALKLVPGHVELITRRDRADRRIIFENDLRAGAELEKQNNLTDALIQYRNAQALDEGNSAQANIDRVSAAIEAAKKPVADFSPAPPRDPKLDELDRVEKEADNALLHEDFVKAQAAYARASELAAPARKGVYLEKARQSLRSSYLAQARIAENNKDLPRAEIAYAKALEILNDTAIAEKLDALRQQIRAEEKTDAKYLETMREGQDAMDKNDFAQARIKFGVAMGLKPDFSPPASKLNEVDARELFVKGDIAREAGDLAQARKLYEAARAKCAALDNEAKARIDALEKAPTRSAKAVARACALASERKDDEAVAVLDEALKLEPGADALKTARAALDAARSAEDVVEQLQKVSSDAMERIKAGAELDEDDDASKTFIVALAKTQVKLLEKSKRPLGDFAAGDFNAASTHLASARALAGELQTELQKTAAHFTKQAEKFAGVKVPFIPKMAVGGDRKKGEKYHSLAESLTQLVGQAKALLKP